MQPASRAAAAADARSPRRVPAEKLVADTVAEVIQRADELTELVAIYWRNGKRAAVGAAQEGARTRLRQVRRLPAGEVRPRRAGEAARRAVPRPRQAEGDEQAAIVAASSPTRSSIARHLGGRAVGRRRQEGDVRAAAPEGKLGYLALLRNLRNMAEAGVDEELVRDAILARKGAGACCRSASWRRRARRRGSSRGLDKALQAAIADQAQRCRAGRWCWSTCRARWTRRCRGGRI